MITIGLLSSNGIFIGLLSQNFRSNNFCEVVIGLQSDYNRFGSRCVPMCPVMLYPTLLHPDYYRIDVGYYRIVLILKITIGVTIDYYSS
jgi:hypothetical protein